MTASRIALAVALLACLAHSLPLDCPINRRTDWEVLAGKNVSKVIINIKLPNGKCIEVFDMSTPTSYTTSRAQGCVFCIEDHCVSVPKLPSPPGCLVVQGPDCGVYFVAAGDRRLPCAPLLGK